MVIKTGNPSTIKILRVIGSDDGKKKGHLIYHFLFDALVERCDRL